MDSSENENLLLKQYGRFKRMELEKSPFHFLLPDESHIDPNPHQINAFCAAIDAMKTGGMVLADEVGLDKTISHSPTMPTRQTKPSSTSRHPDTQPLKQHTPHHQPTHVTLI